MSLVDFIGFIGFLFSFALLASPIPSILEGIKKMEIKNITLEYLMIGAIQATFWLAYGHKNNDFYTYLTNDVCIILFTTYLNAYLYANRMTDKVFLYNGIIAANLFITLIFFSGNFSLTVAAVISTIWQLATIRNMKKAVEKKDATFINLLIATVSLVCFGLWIFYSLLTKNYLMTIPNSLGSIIFSLNLVIYYWANNKISDDNIIIVTLKQSFSKMTFLNETNQENDKNDIEGRNNEPLIKNLKTSQSSINKF